MTKKTTVKPARKQPFAVKLPGELGDAFAARLESSGLSAAQAIREAVAAWLGVSVPPVQHGGYRHGKRRE